VPPFATASRETPFLHPWAASSGRRFLETAGHFLFTVQAGGRCAGVFLYGGTVFIGNYSSSGVLIPISIGIPSRQIARSVCEEARRSPHSQLAHRHRADASRNRHHRCKSANGEDRAEVPQMGGEAGTGSGNRKRNQWKETRTTLRDTHEASWPKSPKDLASKRQTIEDIKGCQLARPTVGGRSIAPDQKV